jgi:hypothetical protein
LAKFKRLAHDLAGELDAFLDREAVTSQFVGDIPGRHWLRRSAPNRCRDG